MITLALDTATASPSVALTRDGRVCAELWLGAEAGSGRRVLEAVHHLLGAAGADLRDIDRIVVGIGPGGFTGLRIGLATALGLSQALGRPVHGAVSLEALALSLADAAPGHDLYVPVIDARRREVFAAAYRLGADGDLRQVIGPCAIAPADLAVRLLETTDDAVLGGPGLTAAGQARTHPEITALPDAAHGHRLRAALLVERVDAGAAHPARPLSARLPDAEINRRAAAAAAVE